MSASLGILLARAAARFDAVCFASLAVLVLIAAPRARAATPPATVAVSYFDNNSGQAELDPLAKGLADMLITDLSQLSSLRIVERQKLNQVLAELKLSRSKFIDPKTAQRLGKGLAAQFILSGGYSVVGNTLRIDARVFNVQTAAVLTSQRVEGSKDEFFALEKEIAELLIAALSLKLQPAERSKLRTNPTQSFDAWSSYARGLDAQDKGDAARARAEFEKALAADPNYRAARSASERLAAVFAHNASQTEGQFDASFRELDPKAPDFVKRVDALLASLDGKKSEQLARKLALLSWLGRRNLLACAQTSGPALGNTNNLSGGIPQGGLVSHCPQVQEVLLLAYRGLEDPGQWRAIPKLCESFIGRLPGDKALLAYCEMLMQSLSSRQESGAAAAVKELAEDDEWVRANVKPDDWRRALLDNRPAARALVQLYAAQPR
jgi:TolB-like protein